MDNKDNRKFVKIKKRSIWKRRKDYSDHLTFGVSTAPLPDKLLFLSDVLDQGSSEHCTAYTAVALRSSMTGKKYDPEGQWKLELQFLGVSDAPNGVDLEVPMKTGTQLGFAPTDGNTSPVDKAGAYFSVSRGLGQDMFDAVKYAINRIQAPLSVGVMWYRDWDSSDGIVPHTRQNLLGGHNTKIAGFTSLDIPEIGYVSDGIERLVIQGSWGPGFGKKGCFFFDRYMTNLCFNLGIFYFSDNVPQEVQRNGLIRSILQNLLDLYTQLLSKVQNQPTEPVIMPDQNNPPQVNPTPQAPKYLWDNHNDSRHSVRLICDEEGLSVELKNDLTACLEVESGINNSIQPHENVDKIGRIWSKDWGICQINDYWHIGPGKDFPSVDYVMANPEVCVRWMARQFKAGNAKLWSSYTSGAYRKYL